MQTTLVKPFILDLLAKVEEQKRIEEEKTNPRKAILLKATMMFKMSPRGRQIEPFSPSPLLDEESTESEDSEEVDHVSPVKDMHRTKKVESLH